MKIITWNINGYRSITGQNPSKRYDTITHNNTLFEYIAGEDPDIICLQETKADIEQINEDLRFPPKYYGYYHSCSRKKGYSGVVTFSKKEALNVNYKIGTDKFDSEGRTAETEFDDFILFNVYFPKGYADSERLDFKLEFYDTFFEYCQSRKSAGKPLIICGDYNTAHTEKDLARPKQNTGTSGFMPEERHKIDKIISMGYKDAFREIVSESGHYTWWSQRGRARENNVGWRIDYHFISNSLVPNLTNAYQQPHILGSDHCPVVIELNF